MTKLSAIAVLIAFSVPCFAQEQNPEIKEPANLLEFRGSSTQYRYADWAHTQDQKFLGLPLVADLSYIGGQGFNEVNAGIGVTIAIGKAATLIPVLYATGGTKAPQTGAKFGLIGSVQYGDWKGGFYLAQFCRIGNSTPNYLVLDTGDVTRKITGRWEAGLSTGFLRQSGKWNPQIGPLARWNNWSVSYRLGSGGRELRFGKVYTF